MGSADERAASEKAESESSGRSLAQLPLLPRRRRFQCLQAIQQLFELVILQRHRSRAFPHFFGFCRLWACSLHDHIDIFLRQHHLIAHDATSTVFSCYLSDPARRPTHMCGKFFWCREFGGCNHDFFLRMKVGAGARTISPQANFPFHRGRAWPPTRQVHFPRTREHSE